MATIVLHEKTKTEYLLLGSGLGIYQSESGRQILNDEGWYAMVSVCDDKGHILWFEHEELQVISINGQHPSSLLRRGVYR